MPTSKPRPRRRRASREGGVAIVVVLSLSIPILIVSGTMLAVVVNGHSELEAEMVDRSAHQVAVSGMHQVLSAISRGEARGESWTMEIDGSEVEVELTDWGTDKIDNDGDGVVDSGEEERMLHVRCVSWVHAGQGTREATNASAHSAHSTCEVLLLRNETEVVVNSAVYLDDPLSDVKISGNSFLISGYDTDLDGSDGGAEDVPAIGVAGDPADVIDSISRQQRDNLKGAGGSPSVLEVDVVDLTDTVRALVPMADIQLFDSSASLTGSIGTQEDPKIVYARHDLKIHGGTDGAGVLLVEGDLTLTGNFDWTGLIIAGGSVRFSGGGQRKDIRGAVLCVGNLSAWIWGTFDGDDDGDDSTTINGSVDIRYSSEGIQTVTEVLTAGYTVLSWSES